MRHKRTGPDTRNITGIPDLLRDLFHRHREFLIRHIFTQCHLPSFIHLEYFIGKVPLSDDIETGLHILISNGKTVVIPRTEDRRMALIAFPVPLCLPPRKCLYFLIRIIHYGDPDGFRGNGLTRLQFDMKDGLCPKVHKIRIFIQFKNCLEQLISSGQKFHRKHTVIRSFKQCQMITDDAGSASFFHAVS